MADEYKTHRNIPPIIAAVCTHCNNRVILTEGTKAPESQSHTNSLTLKYKCNNNKKQEYKYKFSASVDLVPPGTSIREKLHSEEKYLGRKGAAARGGWSWRFLEDQDGDDDHDCVLIMMVMVMVMIKNHPHLLPSLTAKTWMVP